jgi:hypothetical protein
MSSSMSRCEIGLAWFLPPGTGVRIPQTSTVFEATITLPAWCSERFSCLSLTLKKSVDFLLKVYMFVSVPGGRLAFAYAKRLSLPYGKVCFPFRQCRAKGNLECKGSQYKM